MTFMIAWSLGRAHFKVTISRFPRKRCWSAGGRHAVGPMAFPNHPWTEAGMKKLFCVPILCVALLLALGPACPAPGREQATQMQFRHRNLFPIEGEIAIG